MLQGWVAIVWNPEFRPTAMKVALVVGTVLFTINHGHAVLQGKMTRDRWLAAALTYLVPYCVNLHGQYQGRRRLQGVAPEETAQQEAEMAKLEASSPSLPS